MSLYIGLMSGTSMDGVDAALAEFDGPKIRVLATSKTPYPQSLHDRLVKAIAPNATISLHEFGSLDVEVGRCFAKSANGLLEQTSISSERIRAIGSHGQTLRHSPDSDPAYTIQIGDPATIAARCSVLTVADFRTLDVAAGGQGAPLVPPFHQAFLGDPSKNTAVVNIGGIANITLIPGNSNEALLGFDTGPGNCLLDEWIKATRGVDYDENGAWAKSGTVCDELLNKLMGDQYIGRLPPKSTGREYFNLQYLRHHITALGLPKLSSADVQATLVAYTTASIAHGVQQTSAQPEHVFVCGGGAKNDSIMSGLRNSLPKSTVSSTASVGLDPEMIESFAFAWLAHQRVDGKLVKLTTGSTGVSRLLGALYEARSSTAAGIL